MLESNALLKLQKRRIMRFIDSDYGIPTNFKVNIGRNSAKKISIVQIFLQTVKTVIVRVVHALHIKA